MVATAKNSYVMLNGIPMPVAVGSVQKTFEDIRASPKRAYSGRYVISRGPEKGKYTFKTPPLPKERADEFRKMINGRGQSFPLSGETVSAKGTRSFLSHHLLPQKGLDGHRLDTYTSTGQKRFGGVLDKHIFDLNLYQYWDFATLSPAAPNDAWDEWLGETLFDRQGTSRVAANLTSTSQDMRLGTSGTVDGSTYRAVFRYRILKSTSGTFVPEFYLVAYDGSDNVGAVQVGSGVPGVWHTVIVEESTASSPTVYTLRMKANSGEGTIVLDGMSVQDTYDPNEYFYLHGVAIAGSEGNWLRFTDLEASDGKALTLSFWLKNAGSGEVLALREDSADALENATKNAIRLNFVDSTVDKLEVELDGFDEGTAAYFSETLTPTTGVDGTTEWTHFAVVFKNLGDDQQQVEVFSEGGLSARFVLEDKGFDPSKLNLLFLGDSAETRVYDVTSAYTGTFGFEMSDLQILPYAVSAETIDAWARAESTPNGLSPQMTLEGLIEDRYGVLVQGWAETAQGIAFANKDGSWEDGEVLSVTLHEV